MNYLNVLLIVFMLLNLSCENLQPILIDEVKEEVIEEVIVDEVIKTKEESLKELFNSHPEFITDGFDYPVGKPDAKGYYNAQGFGVNAHLGDDWNSVTGGNSDLGDPIYSIANGYVNFAENFYGGWGKVVRIWHKINDSTFVESVYAHCDTMFVEKGQFVKKGDNIATMGNADGIYLAHLHFEIRDSIFWPIGGGYDAISDGYLDPTLFIKANRR